MNECMNESMNEYGGDKFYEVFACEMLNFIQD